MHLLELLDGLDALVPRDTSGGVSVVSEYDEGSGQCGLRQG